MCHRYHEYSIKIQCGSFPSGIIRIKILHPLYHSMPYPNELQTPYVAYPSKTLDPFRQLAKQAHYP